MKVKRLKDVIYKYNPNDYPIFPFNLKIKTNDAQVKGVIDLTKREFLALIKWGLKEGEWSSKELEPIHKQLKSVFINLKE